MKPLARTEGLLKQVVGNETLVYDRGDATSCCLNPLLSAVWRHCDGKHSVEELAIEVAREMPLPSDVEPTLIIERALAELEEHGLLVAGSDRIASHDAKRREIIMAAAMIPLFPGIKRILAPTALNAVSTPTSTASGTSSVSLSASPDVTPTTTSSSSATATVSPTGSATPGLTPTATTSRSATQSFSATQSLSASRSASASLTPSNSPTGSPRTP